MSNTIGRAKILTAPCIFFKKRRAVPVRGGFRGEFSGRIFGAGRRERRPGQAGRGGTETGQDRTSRRPGQSGTGGTRRTWRTRAGGERGANGSDGPAKRRRGDRSWPSVDAGAETGKTKKTGETRKNGKTGKAGKTGENRKNRKKAGKCWKKLEKTGKSDRGLPGRRSGGTGRERHSAVKPRRYRSLKPSSSTSTGQYSRSSSRRKRTV